MFSKLIFAALCAMASSHMIDLNNYTFDQYLADFKMKLNPSEIEFKRTIFLTELARVKAHNAKNLSWKETMNKHSLLSTKEKAALKGRHKGLARSQEKMLKNSKSLPADFQMKPVSSLPASVDWREKGMNIFIIFIFVMIFFLQL